MFKTAEGHRRCMALQDRMLGQISVPYEAQFVQTRFGVTHVIHAGGNQDPPVFLLHGMNASAGMWVPQINELAKTHSIYAADMPASMGKSTPNRIPREGSAYADWLTDVMDAVQVEAASFIGISFGGWLALKLATVAPQRMISAMLMSSAGFTPQGSRLMFKLTPYLFIMPFLSFDKRAELFLKVMALPGHIPSADEKELFGLLLSEVKHDGRAPEPLPDEALKQLTCPTAVYFGEYEAAFNKDKALARARKLLPNLVDSQIVSGVSHGMNGDDAPGINGMLLRFLAQYHRG